jgi:formiminotetrahydrofolate cyclodeaminase
VQNQTIDSYLKILADRAPAPGGGAVAALHAAQAAALIAMVARYTDGEKYAAHRETVARVIDRADQLRQGSLWLAERDMGAFSAVTDAYALPRGTAGEKAARSTAIAAALLGAAQPPASIIGVADELVDLAETLLPIGNRNVITDVAAAADALRAAVTTARVNIEANLAGVAESPESHRLEVLVGLVDAITARADAVAANVLAGLRR